MHIIRNDPAVLRKYRPTWAVRRGHLYRLKS